MTHLLGDVFPGVPGTAVSHCGRKGVRMTTNTRTLDLCSRCRRKYNALARQHGGQEIPDPALVESYNSAYVECPEAGCTRKTNVIWKVGSLASLGCCPEHAEAVLRKEA